MKTLLTALPMLAFYLALVCGRRLGPTDSTLFVANATMQIIFFAFMARALLKWRRARNLKQFAIAATSVVVACTFAYSPVTSPRAYYSTTFNSSTLLYVAHDSDTGGADTRPSVTGTDDEIRELENKINYGRAFGQPAPGATLHHSLAALPLESLPLIDQSPQVQKPHQIFKGSAKKAAAK